MRRSWALAAAVVAIGILGGCSTPPPALHPPVPGATAATRVTSLVIGGTAVQARNAAGRVMGIQQYSSGTASMVAFLTKILGTPTVQPSAGANVCAQPYARDYWGPTDAGLEVRAPLRPHPLDDSWLVSATASTIGSIHIASSLGFAVGDNTDAVVAGLPAAQTIGMSDPIPEGGSTTQVFTYDLVTTISIGGKQFAYGGTALSSSSIAREIFAPATRLRSGC